VPVLTDLALSFLEAVEGLLVTIKDERPAAFLTPQLKRDLKATEAALSKFRAALLPDDPESRAVGQSLANRYRMVNDIVSFSVGTAEKAFERILAFTNRLDRLPDDALLETSLPDDDPWRARDNDGE
jgi:hypothetical protein